MLRLARIRPRLEQLKQPSSYREFLGCDHRRRRVLEGTFPGERTSNAAGGPGQPHPTQQLLPAAQAGVGLEVRVPNPEHARVVHPPVGAQHSCVEGNRVQGGEQRPEGVPDGCITPINDPDGG